jgi:hypothetical protein
MTLDTIDDQPVREVAEAFEGFDCATDPTLLAPGMLSDGMNVRCDGDGKVRMRPGLRMNLNVPGGMVAAGYRRSAEVMGIGYYDVDGYERTIFFMDDYLWGAPSANNSETAVVIADYGTGNVTSKVYLAQMVDTMFYLINGVLHYATYNAGWTAGSLTLFSDGSTMPTWQRLVVHGFRLFLMEADASKIYASAVGAAKVMANWVKTENFRVGTGEGDPAKALISSQAGYLTLLCSRSAWQIDTSNASVANWTSLRVTGNTGCVAGDTAIQVGQDVLFLARDGVVSLGALSDTISVSPSSALSAPIRPWIERINWTYIATAWSLKWREYFLIALPIDSNVKPKHIFAFNTRTKRWQSPWIYSLPSLTDPDGGVHSFTGFLRGVQTNFGDKEETLLVDICGRVFRLDATCLVDSIDNGSTFEYIPGSAVSRAFIHGAVAELKQPLIAEVEFKDCTASDIDLVLLPDGAAAVTAAGSFPGYQVQLGGATFTAVDGVSRVRRTARNSYVYRQASLQVFARHGGLILTRLALDAFVDARQISNTT